MGYQEAPPQFSTFPTCLNVSGTRLNAYYLIYYLINNLHFFPDSGRGCGEEGVGGVKTDLSVISYVTNGRAGI